MESTFRLPLSLLLLLLLGLTSCIEEEATSNAPSVEDEAAIYQYAYLISDGKPAEGPIPYHVVLTKDAVDEGTDLVGTAQAMTFSYLGTGDLLPGTYAYRKGNNSAEEEVDFYNMEFYEHKNFANNDGFSNFTPWEASIAVRYEGGEQLIDIRTVQNGKERSLATFKGQVKKIDLQAEKEGLDLPPAGIENLGTYGGEEFPFNYGYLQTTPFGITGNVCNAQLIFTPNDVSGEFAMTGISDAIIINFTGMRNQMFGIKRISMNPQSFVDHLGLSFTGGSFLKGMNFQMFSNNEENTSLEGEAIIRFGNGRIDVNFEMKHADGRISKGNYSGEVDEYIYD